MRIFASMKSLLKVLIPSLFFVFACNASSGDDSGKDDKLTAPTSVSISSKTTHSVIISWDSVDAAEMYDWKLDEKNATVKTGTTKNTNIIIDGLSSGHFYMFYVRAVRGNDASDYSKALEVDFGGSNGDDPVNSGDPAAICIDSPLVLKMESTPELGSEGYIRVFDTADNQVDAINLADISTVSIREDGQMIPKSQITTETQFNTFMDAMQSASRWRIIHYTPLRIREKALEVKLHSGVLDFGKEYYVTVDAGVVKGHKGISKGEWTFKTKALPSSNTDLQVNADGSADFCTVQGAIRYSNNAGKNTAVTISIASGTYNETPFIRDKNNLTIKGAGRDNTVVAYANNESYESGSGSTSTSKPAIGSKIGSSGGRGMILVESCDNLILQDITMHNTFGNEKGQAEVIYFNSSYKMTIENCALHSLQDTFLCKGSVWVHNSLIEGHCDYIWGYPKACLFEDCEIRSAAAGYIVQARVQNASDKGFVFLNCRLTAKSGVQNGVMYLARSAGQSEVFDNVTFVDCTMSPVIAAGGWHTNPAPNPSSPTATSGWKEYGSKDASGATLTGHNNYGKYLTADEAKAFSSKEAVLGW